MTYDIIPDIHGQLWKLTSRLESLGYRQRKGVWAHPDPNRRALFLGDLIDRGPHNGEVIKIVRNMVDAGSAFAVMGNHELNAILYHTMHPETGQPLRPHSARNTDQHQAFLKEFPLKTSMAEDAITWMKTLPLFLDLGDFRAVHACWNDAVIARLSQLTDNGRLSDDDFIHAGDKSHEMMKLTEITTKGPEADLPEGYFFTDSHNHDRKVIRVKWWEIDGASWKDIAISVPDHDQLPEGDAPTEVLSATYPGDAPPVFFGHYWLNGPLQQQAANALCLDYSAGLDGPLISYQMKSGERSIDMGKIKGL